MKPSPGALAPYLTPLGHLRLGVDPDLPPLPPALHDRIATAFASGAGHGLLRLGTTEVGSALPPSLAWWRDFAARFVTTVCATAAIDDAAADLASPDRAALEATIVGAPPMTGAEYLLPEVLVTLWGELGTALRKELAASKLDLQAFLKSCHPAWNVVGRVHFNLAENRKDADAPFAFLATYTPRLSAHGKAQHLPLAHALTEFSGAGNRSRLLSLLLPVQRAAEQCGWLHDMVGNGEIYHPLRWTPAHAWQLLQDHQRLEAAGIVVRMPGGWAGGRPPRPRVSASVGAGAPSMLGMDALLDFHAELAVDGDRLTAAEIDTLLAGADGLQWIRGRWVEVDRVRLRRLLDRFASIERAAAAGGVPFAEAMRLLANAATDADTVDIVDWAAVTAGPWLAETLRGLREPEGLAKVDPGSDLGAELRPYQQVGVRWLYLLVRLGLGACLADDMGLGKTIQVLALLLVLKRERRGRDAAPSLLVAPASLLANWVAEAERFAPGLRLLVAHPSAMAADELRGLDAQRLEAFDLVITSYGTLLRLPALAAMRWRLAVIDEAQAIKNPAAKQTRQVKAVKADARIALTGTPVENRLSDLWSIFDYTHPGLLGPATAFGELVKRLAERDDFGPLRRLVRPYILRRMKTDRSVIADLPDKTEQNAWCLLSPKQAALYERAVEELARALQDAEGIGRKGAVLAYLMRFKQICNHPSQWLGDGDWDPEHSGKFARLRELSEVIAARQEKLLVFTQFRETTEPLAGFLGTVFGREGLVLHGATPVARRRALVQRFQEDELTPFFVLSLKAGGAGLNLTAASHVVHFDRWWNPAVEAQATDRAFRIGQKRNVLVHKFVCRGTIEERIDRMIDAKQKLAGDILAGGAEALLTEMGDQELIDLVRLDFRSAQEP